MFNQIHIFWLYKGFVLFYLAQDFAVYGWRFIKSLMHRRAIYILSLNCILRDKCRQKMDFPFYLFPTLFSQLFPTDKDKIQKNIAREIYLI